MLSYAVYHNVFFGLFAQVFQILMLFVYVIGNSFSCHFFETLLPHFQNISLEFPVQITYLLEQHFIQKMYCNHSLYLILNARMSSETVLLLNNLLTHK